MPSPTDTLFGGGGISGTGADPNTFTPGYWAYVKQNNPAYYDSLKEYDPAYKAEQSAAQQAAAAAATAGATQQAAAVNPVAGPTQADTASAALGKLLQGFGGVAGGANFVPGSLDDSAIEGVFGAQRNKAQDYIGNLLKRGVVTPSGQTTALASLGTQEPGVRNKLNDVGNLLLEQERSKVRGIYNEGVQATGQLLAGSEFDPTPYVSRAQQSVGGFQGGLADAIAASAGGDLFDTSGLTSSAGAPASGQAQLDFDPYAGTGNKLTTGLESGGSSSSTKRRSTAVF